MKKASRWPLTFTSILKQNTSLYTTIPFKKKLTMEKIDWNICLSWIKKPIYFLNLWNVVFLRKFELNSILSHYLQFNHWFHQYEISNLYLQYFLILKLLFHPLDLKTLCVFFFLLNQAHINMCWLSHSI